MLYHIYTDIDPPQNLRNKSEKNIFYKMQKERCRDDYAKNRSKKVLEWWLANRTGMMSENISNTHIYMQYGAMQLHYRQRCSCLEQLLYNLTKLH